MKHGNQEIFDTAETAYRRRDFQTALMLWQPLADQGNADAQFWIGMLYECGWGVAWNLGEATKWWHKAAEQGHTEAQALLGTQYLIGEGVKSDHEEAYFWLTLALNGGRSFVCKQRDDAAQRLTKGKKSAADKRVAEWKPTPARR